MTNVTYWSNPNGHRQIQQVDRSSGRFIALKIWVVGRMLVARNSNPCNLTWPKIMLVLLR